MDREQAENLAALDVEGMTPARVREVVSAFVRHLATCTVCGATGKVKFSRDAFVDELADDQHRTAGRAAERMILAGTTIDCPGCSKDDLVSGHDLAWVGWHCQAQRSDRDCRDARGRDDAEHADCGARVLLEVPLGDRAVTPNEA